MASDPSPSLCLISCIIEPQKSYKDRIYTRGVVGWPGVKHLGTWDKFDQVGNFNMQHETSTCNFNMELQLHN
jgi:hydroxylamine reductase (hybrid-cluster protein)